MNSRTRLNIILLAVAIVSAMSVVTARYQSRKLYADLQKEQKFARELEIEFGRLQLEQSTWAAHNLIEQTAVDRLKMRTPDPREVQILKSTAGTK